MSAEGTTYTQSSLAAARTCMIAQRISLGQCTVWTGAKTTAGYGVARVGGKLFYVHRLAYEAKHGKIPRGMVIDHLCRTRACIDDAHMEVVTSAENTRRGGNAIKIECKRGHPFDERNTRIRRGKRYCRICAASRSRAV